MIFSYLGGALTRIDESIDDYARANIESEILRDILLETARAYQLRHGYMDCRPGGDAAAACGSGQELSACEHGCIARRIYARLDAIDGDNPFVREMRRQRSIPGRG